MKRVERSPDRSEQLSRADASNVALDSPDQVNAFLMAGVLGRGGFVDADGVADLGTLREILSHRIGSDRGLRRLRQQVGAQNGLLGRGLVWRSSPPDLSWHVRLADPVSGLTGLARFCATLMTTAMPMDRPLWELLVVPGAAPEGPGIVLRVHHAVADGVAMVHLAQRLFDTPEPPTPTPPTPPGTLRTSTPRVQGKPPPRGIARSLATGIRRVGALARNTVPATPLLGQIGPHRGIALCEVDVSSVARGSAAAGGTVNDALLAATAHAVGTMLHQTGNTVPQVLPVSVPVALPERGTSGNAVGVMLVPLPTDEPDPAVRIARIAQVTGAAKVRAREQGTLELTRTRWGTRLFAALARRQRLVAFFVTNVRGPSRPLQLAGARLEHAWPITAIQGNVRLGVAAFSYAGHLACAVHADAEVLDYELLGRALAAELARIATLG